MKQKPGVVPLFPAARTFSPRYDAEALKGDNLLGKKLALKRKSLGLSQKAVVERLKEYNIHVLPAAFCKWEQGYTMPNVYQFLALCSILRIDQPMAFFLADGARVERPGLNARGMKKLQEYYELLRDSGRYTPESDLSAPEEEIEKRVFDLPASAGTGLFLENGDYSVISFPVSAVPDDADFGVRVSGDSMMPRYVSGQIAWVERCAELKNGEIGIFILGGDAYIKKYSEALPAAEEREEYTDSDGFVRPKVTLVSLNPEYDNISVSPEDGLTIVGRVLN